MVEQIALATVKIDATTLRSANRQVLWGWKRDVGECFRVVYFAGEIEIDGDAVSLGYRHFFYRHRLPAAGADYLRDLVERSDKLKPLGVAVAVSRSRISGLADLVVTFGAPREADIDRTNRLQRRRPRRRIGPPANTVPAQAWTPEQILPADLYVGSGLSYEAGLPTLCDVHDFFGVDREDGSDFTVGKEDPLLPRLAHDPIATLRDFCRVHIAALTAAPTPAMEIIRGLRDTGTIGKIFTDNVDNLLAKVHLPFERTRGSGVFNERYPATFSNRNLIVVGVAADRRMLVAQARRMRGRVIIVNPCTTVAPKVRHLDYLREHDLFLKISADTFFRRLHDMLQRSDGPAPGHLRRPLAALLSG